MEGQGTTLPANPQAMALPWKWIVEKLVDSKDIETPLLKAMTINVPDLNSPSSRSFQERIALRYLEEIVYSRKIEAHAIPLVKIFASSSLTNLNRVEDLLLRICTEVVLGHVREADENGERNWEGFEDDLNRLFAEGNPPPFISRRNELMGILKNKSAYVSQLENYPVEVLKSDLLHFVRDQKACLDRTFLDQLVCDINNGRHYACASTANDKHASPTGEECISGGGRKRVYRKDTLEFEDRSSEDHKRLKHGGSDASPSKYYDSFQKEMFLDIQTDNLNNDIQKTTAHGSSDKECRQEVNCSRGEEILPLSNDSESTSNGENADNEIQGVGRQMSEFEDNSDGKKGRMEDRLLVTEELPALDHLLLGNDCSKQFCLKCRKGGALSYCTGCGFAAHDKCLQSGGNVSCHACAYKRALAVFNAAKEQALKSKESLLAFIIVDAIQDNWQKSPERSSSKMEIFPDTRNTYKDPSSDPNTYKDPSSNLTASDIGHPFSKYACDDQHDDDHEASIAKERKNRLRRRKSPVMKNGCDGGHDGNHEAGDAENKKYPFRQRKVQMRGSFRLPGGVRRNKLPWTKEEEKILKEGMQKFAPFETNTIPWKHILEHGKGVFNKSRLPNDLKDKWRNMKKGSS